MAYLGNHIRSHCVIPYLNIQQRPGQFNKTIFKPIVDDQYNSDKAATAVERFQHILYSALFLFLLLGDIRKVENAFLAENAVSAVVQSVVENMFL